MRILKNIDTVDHISKADFESKYLKPQKPLIIKGLAAHCPAGQKWTTDYLKNVCGDVTVDIFDSNAGDHSASAFTTPDLKMKFRDYIDLIIKDQPSSLRIFLFNMFRCKPELRKDFPCPDLMKGIIGKVGLMFFGTKGIKVRVHQDMDMSNVMLVQFYGRKRVVLVAPNYSTLMYRLPFNTHSLIDIDHIDHHKYPGLHFVEASECILEPGDALFMPSGYWHYITYLDGGYAVSYRKLARSFKMKWFGLLSLVVYMPVDKLLNILFGKKWLAKKERVAEIRANRVIRKKLAENDSLRVRRKREEGEFYAQGLRTNHH
jgi:hypothetical protein